MKKLVKIILMTMLLFSSTIVKAQSLPVIPKNPNRPTVALVLSGGGAKGFSHIGVLKVLEEEGIPIDLIVGTSIGSLVGGFYAMGYNVDSLMSLIHQQNWDSLLTDAVDRKYISVNERMLNQRYLVSLPIKEKKLIIPEGAMKGQNVVNLFSGLTANFPSNGDFMQLPIPFASVAADITSGDEVVMTSGNLPLSMYSSMAVPGVFEPARIGNQVLVDGGVVNNFPVDVAKNMGADIIIGVDLRDEYSKAEEINTVGDVVFNLINIYSKAKDLYLPLCDVRIFPDLKGYSAASFSNEACDTLYERGIVAAKGKINEIRALKKKYKLQPKAEIDSQYIAQDKWYITEVDFKGDELHNKEFLSRVIDMPLNCWYSYSEIKVAIDRIYGLGSFKSVYFSLEQNSNGETLVLNLTSQSSTRQNIGLRVNTTEVAALLLNLTWKDYSRALGYFSVAAELSANPGFQAVAETNWLNIPDLGFKFNIKRQDFYLFDNGTKKIKSDLLYTYGKIYMEQRLNYLRIGVSMQEEYYDGNMGDDFSSFFTGASAYLSIDNLDDFYFPTKGSNVYLDFTAEMDNETGHAAASNLMMTAENWIPISHRFTGFLNLYGRVALRKNQPDIKRTLVGGEQYSKYMPYQFPFLGIPPVTRVEANAGILAMGVRFNLVKSHYLTLQFNTLHQVNEEVVYMNDATIYGGGVKYSLKTVIGPLDVAFGLSNFSNRPSFSANLGLWF
ncbi:MAG: patatin-like phospholipase family protein [Mangrovibacterium sp.]